MVFGAGLSAPLTPVPVFEERTLVALADSWQFEASDTDLGRAWRAPAYNDAAWSNGPAVSTPVMASWTACRPLSVPVVSVTASSQYTADGRLAIHAVNGSGLVGNAHVNTPAGTMWLNNGTLAAPNDLNPSITFDLGAVQPVRSMKVWNYNEDLPGQPQLLARGVAQADVLVGITNNVFTTNIAGLTLNKAPGTQTDFSQSIALDGVPARYVKLDKLTNFPGGDNRFVGLSEVQFFRDVDVRRTQAPLGPITYYFRKTFQYAGDPTRAELFLDAAVDDGAVFYLNDVEVHRMNLPAGPVVHGTLASNPVGHATFTGPIAVSAASLVRGRTSWPSRCIRPRPVATRTWSSARRSRLGFFRRPTRPSIRAAWFSTRSARRPLCRSKSRSSARTRNRSMWPATSWHGAALRRTPHIRCRRRSSPPESCWC